MKTILKKTAQILVTLVVLSSFILQPPKVTLIKNSFAIPAMVFWDFSYNHTVQSPINRNEFTIAKYGGRKGRPSGTEPAGPRGPCVKESSLVDRTNYQKEYQLTALAPVIINEPKQIIQDNINSQNTLGITYESQPTFWVYIPDQYKNETLAEFMILDENNNNFFNQPVSVKLAGLSGIIGFSLQGTERYLKINEAYHWFFAVVCDPQKRSKNPTIDAWTQREEIPSNLTHDKIDQAPLTEKLKIYQENQIWHEPLTLLAEKRQKSSQNNSFDRDWHELLQKTNLSEIKLKNIESSSILPLFYLHE